MPNSFDVDSEFLAQLRQELLKQQDRRAEHVRSKFTFVIALGGLVATLQSLRIEDPLAVNLVVYAIPLVAALFDLYIIGGEFAVKRIRAFLILQDRQGVSEKMWAQFLDTWPKDFMRLNRMRTTGFINLSCVGVALGNLVLFRPSHYQWLLFGVWIVALTWLYRHLLGIENTIRHSFSASLGSTQKVVASRD